MSLATLLDPSLLAELEAWRLRTRLKGRGLLEGMHHTQRWGHAATFAGHREYSPGDDLRRLDWRASARSGRWQIKRFERETELTAHLILDTSGSMGFRGDKSGGKTKLEYAERIAAALAYLFVASRDRVGLVAALPSTVRLPARTGPSHLTKMVDVLASLRPHGESDLTATLSALGIALTRRSLLVLLSDFLVALPPLFEVLALLRSQGHELLLLQVLDSDELTFPFRGETRFQSMEEDAWIDADAGEIKAHYLAKMGALLHELKESAEERRLRFATLTTDQPMANVLRAVLEGPEGLR